MKYLKRINEAAENEAEIKSIITDLEDDYPAYTWVVADILIKTGRDRQGYRGITNAGRWISKPTDDQSLTRYSELGYTTRGIRIDIDTRDGQKIQHKLAYSGDTDHNLPLIEMSKSDVDILEIGLRIQRIKSIDSDIRIYMGESTSDFIISFPSP